MRTHKWALYEQYHHNGVIIFKVDATVVMHMRSVNWHHTWRKDKMVDSDSAVPHWSSYDSKSVTITVVMYRTVCDDLYCWMYLIPKKDFTLLTSLFLNDIHWLRFTMIENSSSNDKLFNKYAYSPMFPCFPIFNCVSC